MPVRAYTQADLHAGRGRLERAVFLTATVAAAAFAVAEGNPFYLLIALLAGAIHFAAACRNSEVHVHRLLLNAALLLTGAALLVKHVLLDEDLLVTLGHYVTVILLCKLFERKAPRDYAQIVVLGWLLMVAAALITQALWFAAAAALFVAALCRSAMLLTLRRAMDSAADGAGASRPWPGRALLARQAAVLAALLATGAAFFLVVPRSALPAAGAGRGGRMRTSGFADTVRLGDARSISLSDRVVMHVRPDGPGAETLARRGCLYLRGRVFDEYSASRWLRSRDLERIARVRAEERLLARCCRLDVSLVASLLPASFTAYPCARLEADSPALRVRPMGALAYEVHAGPLAEQTVRYTAEVLNVRPGGEEEAWVDRADPPGPPPPTPLVPAGVAELARQWCADLLARRADPDDGDASRMELDLAVARRLAARLAERYEYSLDLSGADASRDGVEDFLFHLRRGHCEYFASALTVMCQALGVRARLVTGFRSDERDPGGGFVVRQRDAHAWTEVAAPAGGWTTLDATPAASLEAARSRSWLARAAQVYRDLEFAWYDRVVGYDDAARLALASRLRAAATTAWQALRDVAGEALAAMKELLSRGRLGRAALWAVLWAGSAAALAVGAGTLLRRCRRRGAGVRGRAARPAFLSDLLRLLRRRGLRPRPGQTLRELAAMAASRLGLPAAELEGLAALYYRIRWGGWAADPAELREARRTVRRLREHKT